MLSYKHAIFLLIVFKLNDKCGVVRGPKLGTHMW